MALDIQELILHPQKLANRMVAQELQELLERYPYYQAARLLYLKALYLLRDPAFGEELRRTTLYVADRRMLFYLIEGDYYALRPVVKKTSRSKEEEAPVDRTQFLIEAFLNGLPVEPETEEDSMVDDEGLSADYTSYVLRMEDLDDSLEQENEMPKNVRPMRGQHLIDNFIQNGNEKIDAFRTEQVNYEEWENQDVLPKIEEDDGYFTETLAKIYIKQHRYAKALEIIRRLSLKYPKKNAYFADQIRSLEKLVINSNDK